VLGDHRTAEDPPGTAQQVLEQRVLPRREGDPPAAPGHVAGRRIEGEVGEPQHRRPRGGAPPQQGANARQELLERERLGQVIVGAEVESRHLVVDGVARGQEEDRTPDALLAERPEHLEAVAAGQHDVEDDEVVGMVVEGQLQGRIPVGGDLDGVPFLLETLPDEARNLALVLHHQDAHVTSRPRIADDSRLPLFR
jgi:hypothetical protein